jgi:predicted DNA-binding transcriptional regulator AlpA
MSDRSQFAPLAQDRILDIGDAATLAGISRATLYRWSKDGIFPRVIKTGPKRSGISLRALNQWFKERTGMTDVSTESTGDQQAVTAAAGQSGDAGNE